jgi:hypothetical protein
LDDLQKLYGLDGKMLKKLKKKRKKRKKGQKGIKFDKSKDSQMLGVQHFKTNNSNLDTQFLKDQVKSLEDKQNKLLITDIPPNMVNNKLLMDLKQDNDSIKKNMNIMYKQAEDTFYYLYDSIGDFSNNNKPTNYDEQEQKERVKNNLTDPLIYTLVGDYTVNTRDSIGDFSSNNNLSDPNQKEEDNQTNNRLSQISGEIETPSIFTDTELSSLFYDVNTSNVMPSITEDPPEDIKESITEETLSFSSKKDRVTSEKNVFSDETPFIEPQEEILNDQVIDKPPFVPPERKIRENGNSYKARVEYFRKLYYGEPVTEYSIRRYGKNPESII